jgi:dienelactone hydrolase
MQRAKQIIVVAALVFATQAWAGSREAFLKMIDRPRVPLAPVVTPMPDADQFEQFHFTYAADASNRVPGILIRQKARSGRQAVVIALHGTGGKKEGEIPLLKQLAAKGFLAVAIDGRYHGERTKAASGSAEYQQAMLRTYRTGEEHPFLYDTVWDVMRLIDYLVTRPDVDAARIGIYGTSKGGMEVYLAAAVDPRIAAAVPCIGVQSFRWAIDNESWQSRAGTFQVALNTAAKDASAPVDAAFLRKFYDRVAPGVYSEFDGPAMLPLIAPRPLLAINGDSDARTPRPGLMECIAAAKQAYADAGAPEKFEFLLEKDTAHKVTAEARETAVQWLARWLKP